jgi:hypothetical protein
MISAGRWVECHQGLEYRDQDHSEFTLNLEAGGETVLNLTPFLLFDGNCAEAMAWTITHA